MSIEVKLGGVTFPALCKISEIDRDFVGSSNYMGVAYFWSQRHPQKARLCKASISARRKVHNALVLEGLDLEGDTGIHRTIINIALEREEQGAD